MLTILNSPLSIWLAGLSIPSLSPRTSKNNKTMSDSEGDDEFVYDYSDEESTQSTNSKEDNDSQPSNSSQSSDSQLSDSKEPPQTTDEDESIPWPPSPPYKLQKKMSKEDKGFNQQRGGKEEKDEIAAEQAKAARERDRLDLCPHIYGMLVECYYKIRQYHRANSVAREWTEKYKKNVSPYQSLAWCQAEQLQFTDAVATCTACIKRLPETEGMMTIYSIRG